MREVISHVVTSAEYTWRGVKWLWKALGYLIAATLLGFMLSGCASEIVKLNHQLGKPDPFRYPYWMEWPDQAFFDELLILTGDPAAKERALRR